MTNETRIEDILDRARRGERSALDELTLVYRDDLLRFADSRLGPAVRRELGPEDVAQETLVKAFDALARFEWRGEDSFRRWLQGIAEHLIRNASRKRSTSLTSLSLHLPGDEDSPSHDQRKNERFDRLERAIAGLRPEHREVIRLARIEGLRVTEIAELLQRSPGAIHQLLARAMDQLRQRFGDTESLSLPDRALDLEGEPDA